MAIAKEIMRPTDTVGWRVGFRTIWRVTALSWQTPWMVVISLCATTIATSLQLMVPIFLGRAVDQTQAILNSDQGSEAATEALSITALLVLAALVTRGIFTVFQNYFSESVGHHVGYNLRMAYYEKIQRLSYGFHDRMHSGDLITLGMLDLEGMRMFFSTGLVRIVLLGSLIGIGGYLMLSTDLILGLLALSFVPFVGWRSSVTQLKLRSTWLELQNRLSVLSRVMEENLGGIRVVRAFGAKDHEMDKFRTASERALDLAHERVDTRVRNTSMMTFSFLCAMGLVLWIGSGKVMAGDITVGTLASFLTFMTILQMPVRQLGMLVNSFARTATCGERVFALLDLELAITDAPDAPDLVITQGALQFDNVSFTYPAAASSTISGLNFTAQKGETIGVIGPPGSGKSTIAHLIPRFYDVTDGAITLDGQDIRDVTLQSLRRAVVVVQQDAFLFTTSLENNIAYGAPWAPPEQIAGASASAQLDQFIATLPGGYETVVGERGASLSGGQRQRMTIARTLMLRPSVLIFDDSTAAVDAGTEARIRTTIQAQASERVTIIVAHRLNSLMHADRILFIEGGQIVEDGNHAELLALGGRYRALYDLQTRPDAPAVEAAP
jgi:ATP-binding cassette subfamily B multidrug efflux pump